jgi:flagellar assembly factor FliW
LDEAAQRELSIKSQEDMLIYSLITIPGGKIGDMTTNLMAPVVLNKNNMQAKQVVLDKSRYTTKHRLFPEKKEGDE